MKIKQISLFVENKPGTLHAPCKILSDAGISITTLSLADTKFFGVLRMLTADWQKAKESDPPDGIPRYCRPFSGFPRQKRKENSRPVAAGSAGGMWYDMGTGNPSAEPLQRRDTVCLWDGQPRAEEAVSAVVFHPKEVHNGERQKKTGTAANL